MDWISCGTCINKDKKFQVVWYIVKYPNEPINHAVYKNQLKLFFIIWALSFFPFFFLIVQTHIIIFFFVSFENMDRFRCLCFLLLSTLLVLLLLASPRVGAIRTTTFSSPSSAHRQVFRPRDSTSPFAGSEAKDLESEKRKVPTGSNPLHNKRRWVILIYCPHIFLSLFLFNLFDVR